MAKTSAPQSRPSSASDGLIENPLDDERSESDVDRDKSQTDMPHDPGPGLLTNPLDKPGAPDNLIKNPLDKD